MGAVLSFGQDPRWRRALVDARRTRPGQRILDVATGTGMVAIELVTPQRLRGRRRSTRARTMLAAARARGSQHGAAPAIRLVRGEAERLPFADGEFDALTFTYLLRYVDDPAATMRELARVVKPGGRIGMLEFGVPQLGAAAAAVARPHAGRAAAARPDRLAGLVRGRALPRAQHRAAYTPHHPDLTALWSEAGIEA